MERKIFSAKFNLNPEDIEQFRAVMKQLALPEGITTKEIYYKRYVYCRIYFLEEPTKFFIDEFGDIYFINESDYYSSYMTMRMLLNEYESFKKYR